MVRGGGGGGGGGAWCRCWTSARISRVRVVVWSRSLQQVTLVGKRQELGCWGWTLSPSSLTWGVSPHLLGLVSPHPLSPGASLLSWAWSLPILSHLGRLSSPPGPGLSSSSLTWGISPVLGLVSLPILSHLRQVRAPTCRKLNHIK